jgi:hypothetical protein
MKFSVYHGTRNTIFLVAACATFHWATAQNSIQIPPVTPCLSARDVQSTDLYGTWRFEITPSALAPSNLLQRGSVVFEKNPEFADSVIGWLQWDSRKIFVAGDVEQGSFSLEESDDGTRITAVWEGTVAEGSCGKAITGLRRVGEVSTPFVLRKATGWS